jgi:hypothetical protein
MAAFPLRICSTLLTVNPPSFARSSSDNTSPRWKRSAVKGTLIGVRLQPSQLKALDAWIDNASLIRPEAIRAMLDAVLVVVAKDPGEKRTGNASNKTRAAELAAKVVDKMIDPSAPPEERAQRRRRLTKGPTEFREDRVDLPKTKGK